MGVLWRVLRVKLYVIDTGGDQPVSLVQCKDSVAPVANWSVLSRTNSNKEILVTSTFTNVIAHSKMEHISCSVLIYNILRHNNKDPQCLEKRAKTSNCHLQKCLL